MSDRSGIRFGVAAVAVWRVTHLLAYEDGPGDVVVRARARLGESWAGELMDCFQCLSLWVAAPLALPAARRPREAVPLWLALSGAACLLERLGGGDEHAVLWSEASGTADEAGAGDWAGRRAAAA
jgi:Protein of unknown function (DUF1360)